MKANDNLLSGRIVYPLPPEGQEQQMELDIYTRFMRHLRLIPHSREEIKILSAIQFVATMTANSEAHVTKILVDLGLRAPRFALPASYLDYADSAIVRSDQEFGAASNHLKDLDRHWADIGEQRFSAFQYQYSLGSDKELTDA